MHQLVVRQLCSFREQHFALNSILYRMRVVHAVWSVHTVMWSRHAMLTPSAPPPLSLPPSPIGSCILYSLAVSQVCNLSSPGDAECPLPALPSHLPSHYCSGYCQPLDADVQVCYSREGEGRGRGGGRVLNDLTFFNTY